jgi:2-polyprenyl-6-methoxyphenol hydroxylase-like FAD-dependent oxidoreductase
MTRVVILGGGVAGMSAAQELIERGFEVVVLEHSDSCSEELRWDSSKAEFVHCYRRCSPIKTLCMFSTM